MCTIAATQQSLMKRKFKYYILNKPYGVLSQFTDGEGRMTLSDIGIFPKDVYSVGRLDFDSEGLLLLSDDKQLVDFLLNPKTHHEKEYYVQVEGIPAGEALESLRRGVEIRGEKTRPAKVGLIDDPGFPVRVPPIRERKTIPTAWLSISITEGKNRQVRKMTAAVGYPTLRLVRVRIKNLRLEDLQPGQYRELAEKEIEGLKK